MGRALISAFLPDLLELISQLKSSGMRPDTSEVMGELMANLRILDGLVDDAEQKLFPGRGGKATEVEEWLNELQHAVYRLEDLLLQIMTPVKSWRSQGREFFEVFSTIEKADEDIRDMIKSLEGLVRKKDALDLNQRSAQRGSLQGLPSFSAVLDNYFYGKYPKDCFYGRDKEEKSILENLLSTSESAHIKVINMVGKAGAGKTALARVIYLNHKVIESFELRAWVTVPYKATVDIIAKEILEALAFYSGTDDDFDGLRYRLQERLAGEKFLLVLDDIEVDLHELSMLIDCFESAAKGTAIILTSMEGPRLQLPVRADGHIVHLGSLAMEHSWSIFLVHASSGQMDLREHPELAAIGFQMVNKLGNLPLGAKMIGSLLQDKLHLDQWVETSRSKLLDAGDASLGLSIPSFLTLCYLDLPAQIKRCFVYLSLFPKGYRLQQKQVVFLWMAQGFLKGSDSESSGKSMEDVGDEYFGHLITRSFLQPYGFGSRVSSFIMHNLVHDLATYVFGESFKHHFSYPTSREEFPDSFSDRHGQSLRTILPLERGLGRFDVDFSTKMWSPRVLRVLSLSYYDIRSLSALIGTLSHLCYLDLSYTDIWKLPDPICDLLNLQTLMLTYCTSLTSLPERICNLTNLRHLDVRGSGVQEMPLQMHELTSLRTLTDFFVSKNGATLGDLARLSNLKTLTISKLQNVAYAKDASNAKLKEKKSLDDLILRFDIGSDSNGNEMEVLENLEPHEGLKRLTVTYYSGARFPNWLGDPSYWALQLVALRDCKNCNSLPTLGMLPFLKDLFIQGFTSVSSIGLEFYGEMSASQKPFQSLESLQFQDLLEWKEWSIIEGIEFPHLIQLCIIRCPKLVGDLPKKLRSLKKLEIIGCFDLVASIPKVPNTCEVFVNESDEILMRDDFESHSQASLRRVIVSGEIHEFTPGSYSDFPSTSTTSEIEEIPHEARMETQSAGSGLPLDSSSLDTTRIPELKEISSGFLSHQVEADIPNIKQQTDPQSSMAKAAIPITPKAAVFPLTDAPNTTAPVMVETLSKEDLDDERSSFQILKISTVSQLKSLPPRLHSLKIEGCELLEALPDDLLGEITTLKELYLISCSTLRSLPYPDSLTTLYMHNCRRLEFLPSLESRKKLSFLHHLFIGSSCDSLTTLPLDLFSQLRTFSVWDCPNLRSFDVAREPRGDLASLESLEIKDCPRLESFPDEGLHTPNLASILLSNCKNLKKLPNAMNSLTSLKSLFLHKCPQIESLPSGGLPSNLVFLSIAYCDKLTPRKDWGLYGLESLHHFELEGGCIGMESFPEENLLPCYIKSLHISTLKSLEKLDYKGFQHLNDFQKLEIHCCDMLRSLPDQGLPSSLDRLCVQECPLLTPRLNSLTGDEWHKVAHIPHIQIDHQVLS